MRIAILTDAWHPQISGVVTTLSRTIQEVESMGHTVCCLHPGTFSKTIPCPTYPQISLAVNPLERTFRILDRFRPEAVHIVTEGPIGLAGRTYCRRRGQPFSTAFCTRFDEYIEMRFRIPGPLILGLMRWFHNGAARVMISSIPLKQELESKGFTNIIIWPRGVDTDLFRPRDKAFLKCSRPVFTYVGRVAVEKNIEAFLSMDLPGTKLVVGDGPAMGAMKARFPEALFIGPRTGVDLARHYAASDVFVFPSRTDTFGIVMLEALACGVPVAGFPVRGPIDIIDHGKTGFLSQELRQAALDCLTLDPETCRKAALPYSWERSARCFLENLATV
jgi:glycosyltransferase involved in cell wall biosynthesis